MIHGNRKGFTLIELIIVMGVIAVTGAMAAISIESSYMRNLKRICAEFLSDVRYAQRMSLIEGKVYGVTIDEVEQGYSCYYYDLSVKYRLKHMTYFRNGTRIEPGIGKNKVDIEYTPWGTLSKGSQTIYISNEKYIAEITIIPATGRISIKSIIKKGT